ncbi:MAG: LCP family protein [Marmoricola sp.]
MPEFNEPPGPGLGAPELPVESTEEITVTPVGKRKLLKERKKRSLARRITYWIIGLVALALIAYGGFYGYILWKVEHNIRHSGAIKGLNAKPTGKGMDLLLMGLDSRLDENGHALSKQIYNALHAGEADVGGNNSNVLMYVHVADDGSRAVAVSIPRDDWVEIAGCTTDARLRYYVGSSCKGKIKSAYGWALAAARDSGKTWQQAKDVARLEEIKTVEQFLHVKISSFVEVTMVAFFEIAQQVGKIQVCVKENTSDTFSGARFRRGLQWINAKEAVAFVRQRRDAHNRYSFTDLDRSRRQQAFIVSLLTQLKKAGTLLDPFTINNIVNVASSNVVISDGLDPIDVAKLASNLSDGNLHFYTLPIVTDSYYPFGPGGEVANEVDLTKIRAIVKNVLNPPKPVKAKPLPTGAGYTVNAINASGVNHAAATQLTTLAKFNYTAGKATGAGKIAAGSTISYNPADKAAAQVLAKRLGGTIKLVANAKAISRVFTLTVGTALAQKASSAGSASVVPSAVAATGGGTNGPSITDLTNLSGGGIPCVK